MSLVLGIYIKNNVSVAAVEAAALKIFTLNGQRNVRMAAAGHIRMWLSGSPGGFDCVESETSLNLYSGRIYNLKSVKTENVLNDTEMQGLDGEFTWVTVDKIRQSAMLINDFWGLYPLYYTETADYFMFCNEYEPLSVLWDGMPDATSMAAYYIWGAVPGTATFMKNIKNLTPHTLLRFQHGKVVFSTFGKPAIPVNRNINRADATEHIAMLFRKAVQKRVGGLNFGFDTMLTAGADTRLILLCLDNEQRQKLNFVSYLTPPLSPEEDTDVNIASQLATRLKLSHEIRPYTLWDKPFGIDYFYYKRRIADEKYLSGHFGSELLKLELYKATDNNLLKQLSSDTSMPAKWVTRLKIKQGGASLFSKDIRNIISDLDSWLQHEKSQLSYCENNRLLFLLQTATRSFFTYTWKGTRSIYFDQPAYMPLIFIIPFLDKDLLLFWLSLPENYLGLGHDKIYNLLFRNHFSELNDVKTNSPLANDPLAVLKPVAEARMPFEYRNTDYRESLHMALNNNELNKRYNSKHLGKMRAENASDILNKFVDFETWCQYVKTY